MTELVPFYQIDAFTSEPFCGNPAAICFMRTDLNDKEYLSISKEMNLSETAFLDEIDEGVFSLRWFTPVKEVPLCGHATLAAAHLLFNHIGVNVDKIKFETISGPLYAINTPHGVLMDFPSNPPVPVDPPLQILNALGVKRWIDVQYSPGNQKLMIHLESYDVVRRVSPDFRTLLEAENTLGWRAVMVTSSGFDEYDFVSRHFAPFMGVNEDPVTGSNHTILTPYWSKILGKKRMKAYQASERGGSLIVEDKGDRVNIIGRSVLIIEGYLRYLIKEIKN